MIINLTNLASVIYELRESTQTRVLSTMHGITLNNQETSYSD